MFLKNKNIIFKIRRSKVTDYAALTKLNCYQNILRLEYTIKVYNRVKYIEYKTCVIVVASAAINS